MEDIRGKINVKKLSAELRYLAAIITAGKRFMKGGWASKGFTADDVTRFNKLCVLRALHRGRAHWKHMADPEEALEFIGSVIAEFKYAEAPAEPTEQEKKELREARLSRKMRRVNRQSSYLSRVRSSMAEHQGG